MHQFMKRLLSSKGTFCSTEIYLVHIPYLYRGDTWRALRKLLSPTFTSGKIKSMVEPMEGIADSTLNYITKKAKEDPEIEFKSIMQGFSLDCITKVAFGMETNCHLGEDKALFELSKGILKDFFIKTYPMAFLWNFFFLFPEVVKHIGFWPEAAVKIRKMTKDIMNERDEKNVQVGDFVDRLRAFKKVAVAPITDEMIEAQGMVFLLAGFETTASTLSSLIYHVAMYPEVQEKIIEEIIGEAGMMAILRHPNVLQLFGCSLTAQAIWIVSELCSLGSLRQLLDDSERDLSIEFKIALSHTEPTLETQQVNLLYS